MSAIPKGVGALTIASRSNVVSKDNFITFSTRSQTILNGGIATVTKGKGRIYVSSGGTANSTSINSSGSMTISSGGIANFTSAYDWKSYIYVSFGGIVNSTNIRYGGTIHVSYGGVANNTIIDSAGDLYISKGGTANSATVNSKGELHVSSGGTALEIRENGGFVSVEDGANVTFTPNTIKNLVLSTFFSATVHSGTITSMTTINSKGYMHVYSGGKANNTIVNSMGSMSVYSGGTANRITVNSCGSMRISSGGTALDIAENGGFVSVEDGANVTFVLNTLSGLVLDSDNRSATVHSRTTAVNTSIYHAGLYVYGGIANDTTVNSGCLYVASGGTANSTTVDYHGYMYVSSGGTANGTTVNDSYGKMYISNGGIANNTTVNTGGSMYVSSGGTALGIKENGGFVEIANGANVTFTPNTIKNLVLSTFFSATVHSGTSADSPTLNMGGELYIYSGGFATEIKENGGFVSVEEGANVTFAQNAINGVTLNGCSVTIHSGTVANGITTSGSNYVCMYVYSGGIINDTAVVIPYGGRTQKIELYSGAVANNTEVLGFAGGEEGRIVLSGGTANHTVLEHKYGSAQMIVIGGTANETTVNCGAVSVSSGGTANETTVNNGAVSVSSGGTANGTTVNSWGGMRVSNGGIANNTTVNTGGNMYVSSGGIANNTTVNSGGSVYVSNGGRMTGRIAFDASAVVSAARGGVVDFDISELVPKNTVRVNALSIIEGTPIYILTVSGAQTNGTYNLAEGATGFNQSITVMNTSGKELGNLTLGQTAKIRNTSYLLELNEDKLTVTVKSTPDTTPPTVINIKANTTAPAKQIVVTAEFDDDVEVASAFYRIGTGGEWLDYLNGVTVTENTSVYFKAIDISGNESEIARYEITNIDTIPPKEPRVSADITAQTEGNVTVTAVFSEDSTKKEYSFDGNNWNSYTKPITFTKNGTVYFRATDAAGNISEITSYSVNNIGKILPGTMIVSTDITKPTNGNVTVSAVYSDDSVRLEYSRNGTSWSPYTSPIVFSENGTAYFRGVDDQGNTSAVTSFIVDNIDKTAPDKPDVSADTTAPTKRRVLVSAIFSEDSVKKEYSMDAEEWISYTEAVKVTENGTIFFRGTDEAGNTSEIASYKVTNIDKSLSDDGPDDGWNDYLYDKKKGLNPQTDNYPSTLLVKGLSESIPLDKAGSVSVDGRHNFVGKYEDEFIDGADYAKVILETGAKISFTVDSTDAVKFIVYSLAEGTGKKAGIYTMKTLQTSSFKPAKNADYVRANTKMLLLHAGEYYISVQSTNAKKGGSAFYNVNLGEDSVFFTDGDNSDDWTDLKTKGAESGEYAVFGTVNTGTTVILENWVGFGDSVDYARIHLDTAARLNFALNATDAAKVTVYRLIDKTDRKGVTTYSLKSLQATTLKKPKNAEEYTATTKPLLLESGDYYIAIESTNAKKGGNAYYSVELGSGIFYDAGDDGWNNYVYDKKAQDPLNPDKDDFITTDITFATEDILLDRDAANAEWSNFVGFGDAADYAKITLSNDATLSFSLTASDAAKFIIYKLIEGTGKKAGTFTLKQLQATTLKKAKGSDVFSADTKALAVAEGEYYICMQSTNAKKGGSAFYNVELNKAASSSLPDVFAPASGLGDTPAELAMVGSIDEFDGFLVDATTERIFEESGKGILASL